VSFGLEEVPEMVKSAKQKTKAKGKGKRGTVKEWYSASSNLLFLFEYFLFQFDYVDRLCLASFYHL
jgi:hypothetical protein